MKTTPTAATAGRLACDDVGQGLAVVLFHAFPLDREMWSPQVAAISNAGFRAIAVDLPGFGESSPTEAWSVDSAADMIASLLESKGITKVVAAGLSMGGYVAMAVARRHPGLLAGLILADTRAAQDMDQVRANRDRLIAAVRVNGPSAAVDAMLGGLVSEPTRSTNSALVERVRRMILRQKPEGLIAALGALRDRPDATPQLAELQVPALVLVGEFDTLTPLLAAARIAGTIPHSDLTHIPGAAHLSNLENPSAFNAAVLAFLRRLPREG